jgi:hypothetical protein
MHDLIENSEPDSGMLYAEPRDLGACLALGPRNLGTWERMSSDDEMSISVEFGSLDLHILKTEACRASATIESPCFRFTSQATRCECVPSIARPLRLPPTSRHLTLSATVRKCASYLIAADRSAAHRNLTILQISIGDHNRRMLGCSIYSAICARRLCQKVRGNAQSTSTLPARYGNLQNRSTHHLNENSGALTGPRSGMLHPRQRDPSISIRLCVPHLNTLESGRSDDEMPISVEFRSLDQQILEAGHAGSPRQLRSNP